MAAGPMFQPTAPYRRTGDPQVVVKHVHDAVTDGRGVGVLLEIAQPRDTAVLRLHPIGTPVAVRQQIAGMISHVKALLDGIGFHAVGLGCLARSVGSARQADRTMCCTVAT